MTSRASKAFQTSVWVLLFSLGTTGIVLAFSGCSETPKPIYSKAPSFDGDAQNSGFLGWVNSEGHISAEAHERFLRHAAIYGDDFTPKLDPMVGVTALPDGTYLFTKEALAHFAEMERWSASTFKP